MIAVDSNILVRLVVADDPAQFEVVGRLIDRAAADGARLFVSTIVLCETAWVLRTGYDFSRKEIAASLSMLLTAPELTVESADEATVALDSYERGPGDFSDYLVRERSLRAGSHAVATFDRKLLSDEGFVEPDPGAWPDGLSLREEAPRYGRRRLRVTPSRA